MTLDMLEFKPCLRCGELPVIRQCVTDEDEDIHYNFVCKKCGIGYFHLPPEKLPEIFKKWNLKMSDENRERLEKCFHSKQYCTLCGSQRCEQQVNG